MDDQEGTTRRLLEHCGLPWREECLRFYENKAPTATASAAQGAATDLHGVERPLATLQHGARAARAAARAARVPVEMRFRLRRCSWHSLPRRRTRTRTLPTSAPLSTGILTGKSPYAQPVPLAAYAHALRRGARADGIAGRLRFEVAPADAHAKLPARPLEISRRPASEFRQPPAFDFGFVQVNGHLAPVERGIVPAAGDWWDWIVGPGRTWQDGDSGWSRASVPFALIEKNANCMHHGLLTFRYRGDADGLARRVPGVPRGPATTSSSTPGGRRPRPGWRIPPSTSPPSASRMASRFRAACPVKPIGQISKDYPGLNAASFGSEGRHRPARHDGLRRADPRRALRRRLRDAHGLTTRTATRCRCRPYSLAKTLMAGSC